MILFEKQEPGWPNVALLLPEVERSFYIRNCSPILQDKMSSNDRSKRKLLVTSIDIPTNSLGYRIHTRRMNESRLTAF
jgi:hypothetical protein